MERFIIWAGNHEFELIAEVKAALKAKYKKATVMLRNADVYAGPSDVEKCDGVYVQSGYYGIAKDFEAAGIPVIASPEVGIYDSTGTDDKRSEGNEPDNHERYDLEAARSAAEDVVGIPAAEPYQKNNGLEDGNSLPVAGRRVEPGNPKTGRKKK